MVMYLIPLIGQPSLILQPEILLIFFLATILLFTQPVFTKKEAEERQKTDRFSIYKILLATSFSQIISIVEWRFTQSHLSSHLDLSLIWPGLIVMLLGIVLRVWSIRTLGKHFSSLVMMQNQHELIQAGPYKVIRHPSYTGAILAVIGSALILQAFYSLLVIIPLLSWAYRSRIDAEEMTLSSYFGDEYRSYRKHTKKLIPFIW